MIEAFNREDLLIKTSDGKPPEPCSDYDKGYCKSSGELCDACYGNSIELFKQFNNIEL